MFFRWIMCSTVSTESSSIVYTSTVSCFRLSTPASIFEIYSRESTRRLNLSVCFFKPLLFSVWAVSDIAVTGVFIWCAIFARLSAYSLRSFTALSFAAFISVTVLYISSCKRLKLSSFFKRISTSSPELICSRYCVSSWILF
ncbi:unknown [Clostridium sp. CAG:678]|nr:unknown [Clostridium sp. CAG:678]